jgi:hypothetical protein
MQKFIMHDDVHAADVEITKLINYCTICGRKFAQLKTPIPRTPINEARIMHMRGKLQQLCPPPARVRNS